MGCRLRIATKMFEGRRSLPSGDSPLYPSVPLGWPACPSSAPVNARAWLPRHHVLNLKRQQLTLRGQGQHPPAPIRTGQTRGHKALPWPAVAVVILTEIHGVVRGRRTTDPDLLQV